MRKRVLITGISGILGSNLAYCWRDHVDILGLYHLNPVSIEGVRTVSGDLLNIDALKKIIDDFSPEIVIHAAALADVDVCEKNKNLASQINVQGTCNITNAIKNQKTKLIYISTDLVYDGIKGNFSELDPVGPRNQYALTKWEAEEIVHQECSNYLIVRTNFFGWSIAGKRSLAEWLLDELRLGNKVNGFTDAIFSSIYTFDMAQIMSVMIDANLQGTYNLGSRTSLSKYDFLMHIAGRAGLDSALISPLQMEQMAGRATRSKNVSMDVEKLMRDGKLAIPTFEESIEHFVRDISKKAEFVKMMGLSHAKQ